MVTFLTLLTFLSSLFLALRDGLEHGRHVRQPFLAFLFEGLMLFGRLTSKLSGGLPILVIATALTGIMSVVGAPMSLAPLAKLLGFAFIGACSNEPPLG